MSLFYNTNIRANWSRSPRDGLLNQPTIVACIHSIKEIEIFISNTSFPNIFVESRDVATGGGHRGAMPPLVEILAPGQCNIIAYLATYLSHIPVRDSNFPLYIGQNPWKPPNFFLARYSRSSRKTMYPCTKRN